MMRTSTVASAKRRKTPSIPELLHALPDRLQTLLQRRADNDVRPPRALSVAAIKALQHDALRYLTSRQDASRLGDYLGFSVGRSARSMTEALGELHLDDVRSLEVHAEPASALRHEYWLRKASVVQIGADAPTADVLRSIEPLIVDLTVLIFEASHEQEAALHDFLRAYPGLTARALSPASTDAFVITRALTL
jgi:hypothetical protein